MTERFTPDAVLLAAGRGERMRPLTETIPKPLIPVGGMPLIDRVVANCRAEGVRRFAVNAHYLAEQITDHVSRLAARFADTGFAISDERAELLDTGGGARRAMTFIQSDPFFLMNTDSFWVPGEDTPLKRLYEAFDETTEIGVLCVHPARATGFARSHDFCLAPDGMVTNDRGLPVIYSGTALVARSVFAGTPGRAFSFLDLMHAARERGTLRGVLLNAPWLHVGDPAAREAAERVLERFQNKWTPLVRFENATAQEPGASVLIQSERKR